jgi:hypothetical protein
MPIFLCRIILSFPLDGLPFVVFCGQMDYKLKLGAEDIPRATWLARALHLRNKKCSLDMPASTCCAEILRKAIPLAMQQEKWRTELTQLEELGVGEDDRILVPLLERYKGLISDVVAELAELSKSNRNRACSLDGASVAFGGLNFPDNADGQRTNENASGAPTKTQLKKQAKHAAREARKLQRKEGGTAGGAGDSEAKRMQAQAGAAAARAAAGPQGAAAGPRAANGHDACVMRPPGPHPRQ